ncbi:MAG: hypothetical protein PVG39_21570 [Desulfobacteraceae bacterium]|jgi:hypothetical protein
MRIIPQWSIRIWEKYVSEDALHDIFPPPYKFPGPNDKYGWVFIASHRFSGNGKWYGY